MNSVTTSKYYKNIFYVTSRVSVLHTNLPITSNNKYHNNHNINNYENVPKIKMANFPH